MDKLLLNFVTFVGLILTVNTNAGDNFQCHASDHSHCFQGTGQHVIVNNKKYVKYYLSGAEINFICEAHRNSICAQGDGQTLNINGKNMTGSKVKQDGGGQYILIGEDDE